MDQATMAALAGQWGPMGLLIGYLIWDRNSQRSAQERLDSRKSEERARLEEKKMALDHERVEADKALAASLAALTAVIQARK